MASARVVPLVPQTGPSSPTWAACGPPRAGPRRTRAFLGGFARLGPECPAPYPSGRETEPLGEYQTGHSGTGVAEDFRWIRTPGGRQTAAQQRGRTEPGQTEQPPKMIQIAGYKGSDDVDRTAQSGSRLPASPIYHKRPSLTVPNRPCGQEGQIQLLDGGSGDWGRGLPRGAANVENDAATRFPLEVWHVSPRTTKVAYFPGLCCILGLAGVKSPNTEKTAESR